MTMLHGSRKWCIVPLCTSTSVNSPDKIFVTVPKEKKRRKTWMKAVRRDERFGTISDKTVCFVCEDHFKLEEDMENFMGYKMMGGRILMKENIVPHIFNCQPRKPAFSLKSSPAAIKLNRRRMVNDAICSTSYDGEEEGEIAESNEVDEETMDIAPVLEQQEEQKPLLVDKGIQAKPVHYRSVGEMCTPRKLLSSANSSTQTFTSVCNIATSPIKLIASKLSVDEVFSSSSSDDEVENELDSSWNSDNDADDGKHSDTEFISEEYADLELRRTSLQQTRALIDRAPRRYLGVLPAFIYVVDLLAEDIVYHGKWLTPRDIIYIILMKIRLNNSFSIMGDYFGISHSHCSKLFGKYVSVVANNLKQLIVWSSPNVIFRELPVSFQARYWNTQSIIDCFEIEIETPSNSVHQALSWSDYKKCNTIKYLVSTTPDGLVNFLSRGFSGRVTDVTLLLNCGFVDFLKPGMTVMADRGFKNVEKVLAEKGCGLVRPPSIPEGAKFSKELSRETKRIASLRIHVERLIRRFREFKMLAPHACLELKSLRQIDYCVQIAGGLINTQGPLIL